MIGCQFIPSLLASPESGTGRADAQAACIRAAGTFRLQPALTAGRLWVKCSAPGGTPDGGEDVSAEGRPPGTTVVGGADPRCRRDGHRSMWCGHAAGREYGFGRR